MTVAGESIRGFRPFLAKELSEWWHRRAILVTFGAVTFIGVLGTLTTRIDELANKTLASPAALDPTSNVIGGTMDQAVAFAAVFASIGLLIGERASGTMAWTLSKPISRTSFLLSKWLVAVLALAVASVILPIAVSVVVATISYGGIPDLGRVATWALVLISMPAFLVALSLALATLVNSQAGIAAIGVVVLAVPSILIGLAPALAELWPTSMSMVALAMSNGEGANLRTVAGWLLAVLGLIVIANLRFRREDL